MEKITLFTNILPEEQEAMRVCMQARELTFSAHEILMEYSCSMKKIGLILEGEALLYCCDADGTEYILDELSPDSVFGRAFSSLQQFPALLCPGKPPCGFSLSIISM